MKKIDSISGKPVLFLGSDYIVDAVFNRDPEFIVNEAREELSDVNFDSIVGTGLSGSLVVPMLATALKVPWAIVRKTTESSHASSLIEGTVGARWLFVDDFISSGSTKNRVCAVVKDITTANDFVTAYVGTYMYARSRGNRFVSAPHPEA